MNVISVRGRLAQDVKVSLTNSGLHLIKGCVADNYGWGKDKEDKVNWVNFTRFLKKEPTQKYLDILRKGTYVVVDGRLETSKREVDGKTYNNMEVIVNNLDIPFPPAGAVNTTSDGSENTSDSTESTDSTTQTDLPF